LIEKERALSRYWRKPETSSRPILVKWDERGGGREGKSITRKTDESRPSRRKGQVQVGQAKRKQCREGDHFTVLHSNSTGKELREHPGRYRTGGKQGKSVKIAMKNDR